MIRIAISEAAFAAIVRTLPLDRKRDEQRRLPSLCVSLVFKYGCTPMSRNVGDRQKLMLAQAYRHEQRHDGEPAPIAQVLDDAFVSYSNRFDTDKYKGRWGALYKSERFQTRRAIRALIKRGLMEEAGTAISHTGGDIHANSGRY